MGVFCFFTIVPVLAQWEGSYPSSLPQAPDNSAVDAGNLSPGSNTGANGTPVDNTGANGTPVTSGGGATLPNFLGVNSVADLIDEIVRFILTYIVPPFALLMLVLVGFRFVTAQGNEEKLTQAKKNFVYTVLGVAIIYASSVLVGYIRELLGGSSGGLVSSTVDRFRTTLNLVIGLLFVLVTVYFFWGIIQYVSSGGDEEKLKKGRQHMVWGIIGMTIMAGAWGIVNIIRSYLGV